MSVGDAVMFLGNVFFTLAITKLKGIRNVLLVGCLALLGAYAVFYYAQTLTAFYAGWFLFGISQAYVNTASYSVVIDNWFVKKKGTMLGLVFAGTGIGAVIWILQWATHWNIKAGGRPTFIPLPPRPYWRS
jgi:MFS family permease